MKKIIILFSLFSSIYIDGFSQGNLQFNKVIFKNCSFYPPSFSDSLIVPANKVWKIESAGLYRPSGGFSDMGKRLTLGALTLDFVEYVSTTMMANLTKSSFPIWLPEGKYFIGAGGLQTSASLSIIEFNIVP
jgi:hypothetical protein